MKSKKKVSTEIVMFLFLFLSILVVILFIVLRAGGSQCTTPAFNNFSYTIVSQYSHILDIVNNLSLAYIMSYVFYAVALIPERRKQQSINNYIRIYLINLSHLLDNIVSVSKMFTANGKKALADSPNLASTLNKDTEQLVFLTYREHFIRFYMKFNDEYLHLLHYITFVDDDLRDYLYKMITCPSLLLIKELFMNIKNNEFDCVFEKIFDYTFIETLGIEIKKYFDL